MTVCLLETCLELISDAVILKCFWSIRQNLS